MHYAENAAADYVQSAVEAALAIHQEDLPGDILIFLTGQSLHPLLPLTFLESYQSRVS